MNCITPASRGSDKSTLIKNLPLIFRQIGFYLAKCVYFSNLANFSSASGNPANTWFKFEGKIVNDSKVIAFTRNHTDDNETKTLCVPQLGGGDKNE